MIKAIIFDWFNTLARYEPPREKVHSQALKEFGINIEPVKLIAPLLAADKVFFEQNITSPIRKRTAEEQDEFYAHYEEILMMEAGLKFNKDLPHKVFRKGREMFGDQLDFVLFDDVLPGLNALHNLRLTVGLVTNLAKDMAFLIHKLGLGKYLDFVITPYDAGVDKPDPKIFKAALGKAGVTSKEAIYIGDQYKVDILGALSAGIQPMLIDRYGLYPDFKECPRITSLSEIPQYLK